MIGCVPIRQVDRGTGQVVVEDGRCSELLYRENVNCRDDTRVNGSEVVAYSVAGVLGGALLVIVYFAVVFSLGPAGPTHS